MKRLICPSCQKVELVDDRTFVHCARCITPEGYLTPMIEFSMGEWVNVKTFANAALARDKDIPPILDGNTMTIIATKMD